MVRDMFGNKITHDMFGNPLEKENKRQPIAGSQKDRVFDAQKGKCYKCKHSLKLSATQYHHVKFVSKGGKSVTDNLVALCANCHSIIHKEEKAKEMDKKKKGRDNSNGYVINPLTGRKEKGQPFRLF